MDAEIAKDDGDDVNGQFAVEVDDSAEIVGAADR